MHTEMQSGKQKESDMEQNAIIDDYDADDEEEKKGLKTTNK